MMGSAPARSYRCGQRAPWLCVYVCLCADTYTDTGAKDSEMQVDTHIYSDSDSYAANHSTHLAASIFLNVLTMEVKATSACIRPRQKLRTAWRADLCARSAFLSGGGRAAGVWVVLSEAGSDWRRVERGLVRAQHVPGGAGTGGIWERLRQGRAQLESGAASS